MDDNLNERLAFLGINETVKQSLREAKPFIDAALPEILSGFYSHVGQFPEVARMFSGPAMMERAKGLQAKHWGLITSGRFDDAYVASVKAIGEVHHRVGLEPRWYIGGYSYIGCRILEAVSAHLRDGVFNDAVQKRNAWLTALTRAVMLDMDIAISVYLDVTRCKRNEFVNDLATQFQSRVGSVIAEVATSARGIQQSAESLAQVADDSKSKALRVAAASTQTSQAAVGVASASEQLSAAIREISSQIHKASAVTREATEGAQVVRSSMQSLLEQTARINHVTDFISGVATQINLLALNATIEAARAGPAGAGFSVVASEIKSLANQTTKASEEIVQQVQHIHEASTTTDSRVTQIATTIEQINETIASIAAAIEEQSAATSEIAKNVTGTSEASNEVSRSIESVEQGAELTAVSSAEVLKIAATLNEQTNLLRQNVDAFLNTVKAA